MLVLYIEWSICNPCDSKIRARTIKKVENIKQFQVSNFSWGSGTTLALVIFLGRRGEGLALDDSQCAVTTINFSLPCIVVEKRGQNRHQPCHYHISTQCVKRA